MLHLLMLNVGVNCGFVCPHINCYGFYRACYGFYRDFSIMLRNDASPSNAKKKKKLNVGVNCGFVFARYCS